MAKLIPLPSVMGAPNGTGDGAPIMGIMGDILNPRGVMGCILSVFDREKGGIEQMTKPHSLT